MTRSDRTVAAILSAAEGLFLGKNYAEVTMEQIAEKSRVTKGALYHHFASKEDLYLHMMHAALGRMRALFAGALASGKTCRERLERLTRAFLSLPADRIALMRLVRRDVNVFPPSERARLVRAYQEALPDLVEAAVKDGIDSGELAPADPRLVAWHFVATVEVTLGRHAGAVLSTLDARSTHALNLFFHGTAARSSSRGRQGACA